MSNKKVAKRKPGRPALEVTPKILDEVQTLSQIGLTSGQIGQYLGYNETHWSGVVLHRHPEITERMRLGRQKGNAFVLNKLWQKILNNEDKAIFYYLDKLTGLLQAPTINFQQNIDASQNTNLQFNMAHLDDQSLKLLATQAKQLLDSNPTTNETESEGQNGANEKKAQSS